MNPELKQEEAKARPSSAITDVFSGSAGMFLIRDASETMPTGIRQPQPNEKPESLQYVAFDLEIAKEIPEGTKDWNALRPLGISCAATLCSDGTSLLWHGPEQKDGMLAGQMSAEQCRHLAEYLILMQSKGYPILTYNGLGFDFRTLCEECRFEEMDPREDAIWSLVKFVALSDDIRYASKPSIGKGQLINAALNHIDIMFAFFASKGFAIGLDAAAKGMGLPGKSEGMHGSLAPKLWKSGREEQDAILAYCAQDVRTTADLYEAILAKGKLTWRTRRGHLSYWCPEEKRILAVHEALELPEPDVGWMSEPWKREKFYGWTQHKEKS